MASSSKPSEVVVWEWEERPGLWIPYEVDVVRLLEDHLKHRVSRNSKVNLGQSNPRLYCYEVDLVNMEQLNVRSGMLRKVQRRVYSSNSVPGHGVRWEWCCDIGWMAYDIPTSEVIETQRNSGSDVLDLIITPVAIPNVLNFRLMEQINKHTGFKRKVQRLTGQMYPLNTTPSNVVGASPKRDHATSSTHNGHMVPGHTKGKTTKPLNAVGALPKRDHATSSTHNGHMVPGHTKVKTTKPLTAVGALPKRDHVTSSTHNGHMVPGHTKVKTTATPRKGAKPTGIVKKTKKAKVEHAQAVQVGAAANDPLSEFCNDLEKAPDEDCAICFEKLCNISSFDDESENSEEAQPSSVKQLNQCKHAFHASCLQAMYNSGPKNGSLQCPTCKAIHGIKLGNQPVSGHMDIQHSHRSLPGHPDCGMITIVYDFRPGVQGPEHPNPGSRFSARGFPRTCFLPDSQKGKKVLELLKKAWQRRLIFTIGTSSTTGEEDTVVWNEIHHKTEAFSNHMGHGYPDPNYLDNVLAELAAQGVESDDS